MEFSYLGALTRVANSFVVIFIVFCFLNKMYKHKFEKKALYIGAYFLSVLLMWIILGLKIPVLNMAYSLASINILSTFLYKCKFKEAVMYNTAYCIMMMFIDMCTVIVLSSISEKTITQSIENNQLLLFSSILNWIIFLLCYRLVVYFFKSSERTGIKTKEISFLAFLTVFEILIIIYITDIIVDFSSGQHLILILAGFLFLNLYITRLLGQAARAGQLKYELELHRQQSEIRLKYYRELSEKQQLSRKIIHDIKNHLAAIEGLTNKGDGVKTEEYSGLLHTELDKLSFGFLCNSEILSVILGSKLTQAAALQIELVTDIEDVSLDFMSDLDITAVFANLLDNSFEASGALEPEERKVYLHLRQQSQFILINISNNIKTPPRQNGRLFFSSKAGHEGIGLSSVMSSVENYDGTFSAQATDGRFVVKITIPIEKKTEIA